MTRIPASASAARNASRTSEHSCLLKAFIWSARLNVIVATRSCASQINVSYVILCSGYTALLVLLIDRHGERDQSSWRDIDDLICLFVKQFAGRQAIVSTSRTMLMSNRQLLDKYNFGTQAERGNDGEKRNALRIISTSPSLRRRPLPDDRTRPTFRAEDNATASERKCWCG